VICALAKRLGAEHPGFDMTAREIIDETLKASGWPTLTRLAAEKWHDCQPDFETAHYLNGFANPDGKFHFKPDWTRFKPHGYAPEGERGVIPALPDHWAVIEEATHELAFIATGLYGKPIPRQNGAPLRLAVPWKYGFKSIKSIVRFNFTETTE